MKEVLEEPEKVNVSDVRKGERVRITYRSRQSKSQVEHEGKVISASRTGTTTRYFVLLGDNDIEYYVERYEEIKSTGENQRKLSTNRPTIHRLEALVEEEWSEESQYEALKISTGKSKIMRCPRCRERDATIAQRTEDSVKLSCGSCHSTTELSDQPLEISLKVQR